MNNNNNNNNLFRVKFPQTCSIDFTQVKYVITEYREFYRNVKHSMQFNINSHNIV